MNHLIVIPTYNEVDTIERITAAIFNLYDTVNILIVDDSSPDGTIEKVKGLQNRFSKLHLMVQDKKYGLAHAYINGIKWGIEHNFDVFSTCDADFSHNPKYFREIIELLNDGWEVISGSRYIKGGKTHEKNLFKNLISISGNAYTRLILGGQIFDWTGGFNTYTKKAIENINLDSIKSKGYIFQAEMKYKAIHSGCRFKEFPIDFEIRKEGNSKMSFNIIFEALFQVIKIRLNLI